MNNIPVFTVPAGMASLILRDVQENGRAYVMVRDVWTTPEELLEECAHFCTMAGAGEILASWEQNPLPGTPAYELVEYACPKAQLPPPDGKLELVPLTPENSSAYLEVYNTCFRDLPGAAVYRPWDLKRLYDTDQAWLGLAAGEPAAVAEISKTGLESLGVLPQFHGLGYSMACAVFPMVPNSQVRLRVASTNRRAIRLYERLGFVRGDTISCWFRFP